MLASPETFSVGDGAADAKIRRDNEQAIKPH
jgi:hypothetical protein